ncbi:GGDEF domain-containing protein [Lachnobacterium bovis]|uniref:Diguanylate cyclase (GGDEF) domain-containing protein n=1 Tax=Lachnobacterium bovis TaxID=140626 RepID=A0A1H9PAM4_9FIRM|nr:GGDEF domain-containing protein [Lachnobacterium bovis]SER44955.1 diguanylate cyclase (GGDEF) domain-containing protein [Lachnobacterium bovis]
MYYSSYALLTIILIVICNYDVFVKDDYFEILEDVGPYRHYLCAVVVFLITDTMWGVLYEYHLVALCYIDTVLYFITLSTVLYLWTRYVVIYLKTEDKIGTIIMKSGALAAIVTIILLIVNFFHPIFFKFTLDGVYVPKVMRNVLVTIEVVLYFSSSMLAFYVSRKQKNNYRFRVVGGVGLLLTVFGVMQFYVDKLPLSTIGYTIGTSLLHSFVLEDEKKESNRRLKRLLEHEKKQYEELEKTRKIAFVDALTGVHSKHSYFEYEKVLNKRIENKEGLQFAVIVFDLNNLKKINDELGHDCGDKYIKDGCKLICNVFAHSPIFRVGGDEFVAVLQGRDYLNREYLTKTFSRMVMNNTEINGVVVAWGMDEYIVEKDDDYQAVFERADKKMYENKRQLKEKKVFNDV